MEIRRYQQIASKALKTMVLLKHGQVRAYLPETKWFNRETLFYMLEKYASVYIKPDKGGGGAGIIRVRKWNEKSYECCSPYGCSIVASSQLFKWIEQRFLPKKRYIVQQGISLATVHGRPFDLRIFLQKPENEWKVTGIVAKIAAPGKIVTNYCKGGTPCNAVQALLSITKNNYGKTKGHLKEISFLSKRVAKILNNKFIGLKELGIDAGIDQQGKLWIFEVNTRPQFKMFSKLPDLGMYRQIIKNHRKII
ncbi:YheC/YheD family protein [Thermoflavimicrobium dichotomicum]|uniref:YheC/D like ATP-grasp n=1 Tax=Thermoflavimicrobium dichotomicum TaxID=46223 RepID=A0A1I3K9R7_9BACL|nr:YheC/YheD family protein [Thermoflavimicrobium dichotomicum]SFI69124.1 YheC/D like ATP-grasp [Thermoflavimicrobium dichotomicum]